MEELLALQHHLTQHRLSIQPTNTAAILNGCRLMDCRLPLMVDHLSLIHFLYYTSETTVLL